MLGDDTEPVPDIAICRLRTSVPYKERAPHVDDVPLLIEVAESSRVYDRSAKLRLYAQAGIPEYWVVDAVAEVVDVYRSPVAGGYREARRAAGGDVNVSPQAFPDVSVRLIEVFA